MYWWEMWLVCVICTWWCCIYGTFQVQYVYVRARPFGRGQQVWAFAMLSQQGVRATLEGTDGLNSLSPWFTIQTDREEQRARETEHYRGRFNHWNREENPLKNLAVSKLRRYQKLEAPRDNAVPATSSGWKRDRNRPFTGVPKLRMVKTWYSTLEEKCNPEIHSLLATVNVSQKIAMQPKKPKTYMNVLVFILINICTLYSFKVI